MYAFCSKSEGADMPIATSSCSLVQILHVNDLASALLGSIMRKCAHPRDLKMYCVPLSDRAGMRMPAGNQICCCHVLSVGTLRRNDRSSATCR